MSNLLTLEERVSVFRAIDHDLRASLKELCLVAKTAVDDEPLDLETKNVFRESVFGNCDHANRFLEAMDSLTSDKCIKDYAGSKQVTELFTTLLSVFCDKKSSINYKININSSFESKHSVIYTALFNLQKNSIKKIPSKNGIVIISAEEYSGNIKNPVYVHQHRYQQYTPLSGDFIRFSVQDNGPGFSEQYPLSDYIKLGVSTNNGSSKGAISVLSKQKGFGLYYVQLVCKFLQSHMTIESKPGNTTVSIYHPVALINIG